MTEKDDCPCDKCKHGLVCICSSSVCGPLNEWAHFTEMKKVVS